MSRPPEQSGSAAITILLALVALVGLVLGPGQLIYCVFLSGAAASEHECIPDQPLVIALSPDQNPIRFTATMEYVDPGVVIGSSDATSYTGILSHGETELWTETFGIEVRDDDKDSRKSGVRVLLKSTAYSSANIRAFSVDVAGDYTFVAKRTAKRDIRVDSITLKVRENVRMTHVPTAVAGFALLLIAIGFGVLAIVRASRARSRTRASTTN